MSYLVSAVVLALAGTFIVAAAGALRSGHLLFLYVRSGDHIVLERGTDGRYGVLLAPRLPAAVARFARMRCVAAVEGAREKVKRHLPARARAAHV